MISGRFKILIFFVLYALLLFQLKLFQSKLFAQSQKIQIIKPPDFRNRELPAERTFRTKNTALRRFYNNTIARYNYIYNCERLLASIMEQARDNYKDDYDELLSIYNYSLDFIAQKLRPQLDSVLQKSSTGIMMRDLRNKWVDDLYLFMGQAYYFKQEYDSAAMIFQYINFHFQDDKPKQINSKYPQLTRLKKMQLDKIFNREKSGLFAIRPPARNDALIWLLRTYIEQGFEYDAVALMDRLQKDPILPNRLKPFLEETVAYYYYKRGDYLQAAQHYSGSLELSRDRQEKSRRSFLIAQLYNRVGRVDLASKFLRGATKYTYDPVLEIYSRMNFILQEVHPNINIINDHIGYMLRLARQERFKRYKALVYYACSFMALKKNDLSQALNFVNKATKYLRKDDVHESNKIYARLFDLLWNKRQYYLAGKVLDSLQLPDPMPFVRTAEFMERKKYMPEIVALYERRNLYDSLRRLGNYPKSRLMNIIQRLARLQKRELEAGIYKENARSYFAKEGGGRNSKVSYFSSNASIEAGIQEFRRIWGNRKNVDNWRLSSRMGFVAAAKDNNAKSESRATEYSKNLEQRLLAKIPRTPEQKRQNDSLLAYSIFQLAEQIFLNIKDYELAAELYQDILFGFPHFPERETLFLRLYFVLNEADQLKNRQARLDELIIRYKKEYPNGNYAQLINKEHQDDSHRSENRQDIEASKVYTQAFQQFKWRNFPKCMKLLQKLEELDRDGVYRYKSLLMRVIYALSKREQVEAEQYLTQIVNGLTNEPREEDSLVLTRAKELLEHLKNTSFKGN